MHTNMLASYIASYNSCRVEHHSFTVNIIYSCSIVTTCMYVPNLVCLAEVVHYLLFLT